MATTTMAIIRDCNTVRDLLTVLTDIANDAALSDVLDASIESSDSVFTGFRIAEQTLSDKSTVMNFRFLAE